MSSVSLVKEGKGMSHQAEREQVTRTEGARTKGWKGRQETNSKSQIVETVFYQNGNGEPLDSLRKELIKFLDSLFWPHSEWI